MNNYDFSFIEKGKDSDLIAYVKDGKYKNKNIFINFQNKNNNKEEKLKEYLKEKKIKISKIKFDELLDYVEDNEEPDDKMLRDIFKQFKKYISSDSEIRLDESIIQPLPLSYYEDQRDCIICAGDSGSGKTRWISDYCKQFNDMFDNSPIFFISSKKLHDEKDLKGIKNISQLNLDPKYLKELCEDSNVFQNFAHKVNSLVIFDDVESMSKDQDKYVNQIRNSILQVGRSKRIYCISSMHVLNNGHKTKIILGETSKVVLFTDGLTPMALNYFCDKYLSLDEKMIRKIKSIDDGLFTWIMINKKKPRYIMSKRRLLFY